MRIAIVGAGVVGTAFAVRWREAGHDITAVAGRSDATRDRAATYLPDVPHMGDIEAARSASIVVLGVPDDVIAKVAKELVTANAVGPGDRVIHLSGAIGLGALQPARDVHAEVLSLHPLQTFPSVDAALERLPGSPIAVTAATQASAAVGSGLAKDAGGEPFLLEDAQKPLYHAAAVLASNALIAVLGGAEELMTLAGIKDAHHVLESLTRASFQNAAAMGPSAALTGPAVRGDAMTIQRNIEAIAQHDPDLVPIYIALTDLALRVGGDRVAAEARAAVEEVLSAWR